MSIVTPTTTHYELALRMLKQGKHVLVEKPMTDNAAEASDLVRVAKENGCILQVGHVERFNPVFNYLETVVTHPKFIETHRLSPYPARSTDVGVVLDLMIHDLDVVLARADLDRAELQRHLLHPRVLVVGDVGGPVLRRRDGHDGEEPERRQQQRARQ